MAKENTEKIDEIKQRILYFIESQKIGKYNFYNKIGLSSSNFAGKTLYCALSSTKISEFLIMFPQISPDWLLLGKGEMLRSKSVENHGIEVQNNQNTIETQINNIRDMSEHIHGLIDTQSKYLKLLEKENERLLQENERLQQQIANFKKTK